GRARVRRRKRRVGVRERAPARGRGSLAPDLREAPRAGSAEEELVRRAAGDLRVDRRPARVLLAGDERDVAEEGADAGSRRLGGLARPEEREQARAEDRGDLALEDPEVRRGPREVRLPGDEPDAAREAHEQRAALVDVLEGAGADARGGVAVRGHLDPAGAVRREDALRRSAAHDV